MEKEDRIVKINIDTTRTVRITKKMIRATIEDTTVGVMTEIEKITLDTVTVDIMIAIIETIGVSFRKLLHHRKKQSQY